MKKLIINNCMNLVNKYSPDLKKKQIDTIRYGLEGLYLSITKLIIIFIISLILKIQKEFLMLIIIFNIIRLFGFGVHAKRSIDCLISSSIFFIGFPILCKYMILPSIIKIILFIPLIILISIYAPADTEKRPLKNKKKRIMYKILTIIVATIYIILSITIKDNTLSNCFLVAIIIETIIILPLTYKIFKVPYNNYKKYEVSY